MEAGFGVRSSRRRVPALSRIMRKRAGALVEIREISLPLEKCFCNTTRRGSAASLITEHYMAQAPENCDR